MKPGTDFESVKEHFEDFAEKTGLNAPDISPHQRIDVKVAFYAGASAAILEYRKCIHVKMPVSESVSRISSLEKEVVEFAQSVIKAADIEG